MTATLNSSRITRKSLADQIDRLDVILDGLSDALNESVSDAVRGVVGIAVRQAVQASIKELIESPAFLRSALLKHGLDTVPVAEPVEAKPTLRQRLSSHAAAAMNRIRQAGSYVGKKVQQVTRYGVEKLQKVREKTSEAVQNVVSVAQTAGKTCRTFVRLMWLHPVLTLAAVVAGSIGVAVGVVGPREVNAALLGACGTLLAVGGSMMARLRRLVGYLPKLS